MAANLLTFNTEKTELLWAGSRFSARAQLGIKGPLVQFGTETVSASDHVHVPGVTFLSDLSLDKHIAGVCSLDFHWLRQLRLVRQSLDMDSSKILVHAFIASRMDYCNVILAGSPGSMTDKLQHLMNTAARLVTSTHKFNHGLS